MVRNFRKHDTWQDCLHQDFSEPRQYPQAPQPASGEEHMGDTAFQTYLTSESPNQGAPHRDMAWDSHP